MKLKKQVALLLALMMLVAVFAGCNNKQKSTSQNENPVSQKDASVTPESKDTSDAVTIDIGVWSDDEGKRLESAFSGMPDAIGLKINVMKYPSDSDFWDNIPAQIAAGTAPDLISCTNEHYLQYIKEGLFEPLDDAIADGTISTEGIDASALEAWKVDGKTYGVPYALNPGVFIVNNNMWKEMNLGEYPTTWDEVLAICKKYKEMTGEPALCLNVQEYHLTNFALSFGGGWGYGKTIDTDANAKALQFVLDAYREGYIITPTELGLGWDGAVMIQESALFSTGGAWYQASFASEAPDIELKYLSVPTGAENGGLTLHSAALVELKNSEHSEEVKKAIGYAFANEDLFKATVEVTEVVPANSAYHDLYKEKLPELAQLVDFVEKGEAFAYPARSKEFADSLIEQMQGAMFDENSTVTGKDIVKSLAEQFGE